MRNRLINMFGLGLYLFSTYLVASPSNTPPLMAVGSYFSLKASRFPWIVSSHDQGKSWTYLSNIHQHSSDARLFNVKCNNDFCAAVGLQLLDSNKMEPLVAISSDIDKKVWSTISIKPKDFINTDDRIAVDCNDQFCAIATSYINTQNQSLPLISLSRDKGVTWIQSDLISHLPEDFKGIVKFNSVSCSNSLCAASGFYSAGEYDSKVLIAISTDQGNTWSFHTEKFPIDFPGITENSHTSIKCGDSFCVIGVSFYDGGGDKSFILVTQDKGATWSREYIPQGIESAISQVHCHGNTCILPGLIDYNNPFAPILGVTNDAGKSWAYPTIKNTPPNMNSCQINSVSSVGNTLVAGGFVRGEEIQDIKPGFAISKDDGLTWIYHQAVTPLNFTAGLITNVSCNEKSCVATGFYLTLAGRVLPYLITSYDQGTTWSIPPSIYFNLPIDFISEGILMDTFSGSKVKAFALLNRKMN